MGKRHRERLERIQAGVEKPIAAPTDPVDKARHGRCPFPGCPGTPLRAEGAHGFCARHESFVADLVFILPHIQWGPAKATAAGPAAPKSKGGLVLPGSPEFSVLQKNTG
jgi:hypothetical protein